MSHEQPTLETAEKYRETCHCFKMENERYYADNNYYRGTLLTLENNEARDENANEILNDIYKYYSEKGDNYNLLRYYEKIGDRDNSYQIAKQIEQNGTLIEKAFTSQQIWQHFKDNNYKQSATQLFAELIKSCEQQQDNLMSAVYSDILFKITKDEKIRNKAINFHQLFAKEREIKKDSWWQAISLREIAKLSKGTNNQDSALTTAIGQANQQINRAQAAGDFKNAGLWARDIYKLSPSGENLKQAKKLFLQQIENSQQAYEHYQKISDLRVMAKSYWEMWKVTNDEPDRQNAVKYYNELLEKAKKENNDEQQQECYRVLLYIVK